MYLSKVFLIIANINLLEKMPMNLQNETKLFSLIFNQ